jgi:hypothetical protein
MSKLAHSSDEHMRAIELKEAERGKVVTAYWPKPIPPRNFDWCAYRENDEPDDDGHMRQGFGATEADAISELLMMEDE